MNRLEFSADNAYDRLPGEKPCEHATASAEPLYYDGTIYIATSVNDVFAIDVETGEIDWRYEGNVDPQVAQPCCGWAVRGLAMGDGKIFMGKLDAQLVAIVRPRVEPDVHLRVGRLVGRDGRRS